MTQVRSFSGLAWVGHELGVVIRKARDALEEYVEGGGESSVLMPAVDHLSQVRGVLQMLQLFGVARLAEEMQVSAAALGQATLGNPQETAEALMLAMIQLPDYLEKLEGGGEDIPLLLLPAINDLRGSRGAPPLSEADLLISGLIQSVEAGGRSEEASSRLQVLAHQARPRLHKALLAWFRGPNPEYGIQTLGEVFGELAQQAQGEPLLRGMIRAAQAVTEGLIEGSISSDNRVKGLVGRVDRTIKQLEEQGVRAAAEGVPPQELQDLLRLVAAAPSNNALIAAVQADYGLARIFPSDAALAAGRRRMLAPRAAMVGFRAVAVKELLLIKDTLDLFMRSGRDQIAELLELTVPVRRLANTLEMTGLEDLSRRLRERAEDLQSIGSGAAPAEDALLMRIASDLLFVESSLDNMLQVAEDDAEVAGEVSTVPRGEMRGLVVRTLQESAVDMAKAKEAIIAYIAAPANKRPLEVTPALFHGIAGALRVIAHGEAANLLDQISRFIQQTLLNRSLAPDQHILDALADSITSLEYYMEAVADDRVDAADILGIAVGALKRLLLQGEVEEPAAFPPLTAVPKAGPARVSEAQQEREGEPAEISALSAPSAVPLDTEILEIFLEEAREEESVIQEFFRRWRSDLSDTEALTTFRRSFHTLKGSGRLAGAMAIGDYAWAVENLLNRIIDQTLPVSDEVLAYLDRVIEVLPELIEAQEQGRPPRVDVGDFVQRAGELLEQRAGGVGAVIPIEQEVSPPSEFKMEPLLVEEEIGESESETIEFTVEDSELRDIFETESREHLAVLQTSIAGCAGQEAPYPFDEELVRALHTLAGSARMAGIEPIALVAKALERQALPLQEQGLGADALFLGLLSEGTTSIEAMVDALAQRKEQIPDYRDLVARIGTYSAGSAALAAEEEVIRLPEQEVEEIFVEGSPEEQIADPGGMERRGPTETLTGEEVELSLPEIQEEPGVLARGIAAETERSEAMESAQLRETEEEIPLVLEDLTAPLPGEVELPEAAQAPSIAEDWEKQLAAAYRGEQAVLDEAELPLSPPEQESSPVVEEVAEPIPLTTGMAAPPVAVGEDFEELAGDRELQEIFLEEAQDLLQQLDAQLRTWSSTPEDQVVPVQIKRFLHTLKGGARLAGIRSIGDLSHALETLLDGFTPERVRSHTALFPLAQRALDRLSDQVDAVRYGSPVARAQALIDELEYVHADLTGQAAPVPVVGEVEVPQPVEVIKAAAPAAPSQPAQEQVRVRADLLNRLVNNAGEISIYRARLEQQNTVLGFNLGELEQTVTRLHDQLRQMEIETEAQILYRFERDREEGRELTEQQLDPLELDRFSTIQQLSRSLMETVNDLGSIRNLLEDQQSESETLLLQHSRISHDLQDGLLRTRMVPFTQLVPRLRRVVRQTAASLGKRAELSVFGAEGEMDRNILDRMVAPMEHVLRNAVGHGIELPEERRSAGKDEAGKISIYLSREGNDVLIVVTDDGAGLNLAAIRKRAVEKGLLEPDVHMDDDDLMQLVLEPGFSTVKEVTQISGRGVGTDVVVSEVKQLGGSLEIASQPGRGTSFSVRLPFTLAITQALLVGLADEMFAVPHPTMEGVVRIGAAELGRCYEGQQTNFQYAGHDYQVRYLGALLGISPPSIPEGRRWLPLLLVRSGEHRVAIQVDQVIGNRQIVMKSVGVQLSTVRWISGGTILGDGRVALILDVSALVRLDVVQTAQATAALGKGPIERPVQVMVVDDSITVRKVTTRLLKRHNMDVLTAKDGVDAVAQLQEQRPDVMLLDIEMPRMDGYELARHMRNSAELRHIPIIMITSRSGEKHRNIALSLGVKRYLGKPYQEGDLLDNIYGVLAESEAEA
jgi:chemosensory pili system protein ChpA (sensor histidine kinase/response regulator)